MNHGGMSDEKTPGERLVWLEIAQHDTPAIAGIWNMICRALIYLIDWLQL